jgi:predicted PurR-regulated permease PerM
MQTSRPPGGFPIPYWLGTSALLLVGLVALRDFLIPIVIAIFLSFVLSGYVTYFEKRGLGRGWAIFVVMVQVLSLLAVLGWIALQEAERLRESLPLYESNITTKFSELLTFLQDISGRLNVVRIFESLGVRGLFPRGSAARADLFSLYGGTPGSPLAQSMGERLMSLPVTLVPAFLTAVAHAAVGGTITLLFTVSFLYDRSNLRERLIALIGQSHLPVTSTALDEITLRLRKYLIRQGMANAIFGVCLTLILLLLGFPNAGLWGLLSFFLRFVPYVGTWMSLVPPLLLSFAFFDGWYAPASLLGLFIALDSLCAFVVEPMLFGHGTGISPLAVIVGATFWTWVWGAAGLLLGTPIMVTLVVLGAYLPALRPFRLLFSDSLDLTPNARLYHALLRGEHAEAQKIAAIAAEEGSVLSLLDSLLVPILKQVGHDYRRNRLAADSYIDVQNSTVQLSKRLAEREHEEVVRGTSAIAPNFRIAILPVATGPDSACAEVVKAILEPLGGEVSILESTLLVGELPTVIESLRLNALLVVSLSGHRRWRLRYFLRKLEAVGEKVNMYLYSPGAQSGVSSAKIPYLKGVLSLEEWVGEIRSFGQSLPQEGGSWKGFLGVSFSHHRFYMWNLLSAWIEGAVNM